MAINLAADAIEESYLCGVRRVVPEGLRNKHCVARRLALLRRGNNLRTSQGVGTARGCGRHRGVEGIRELQRGSEGDEFVQSNLGCRIYRRALNVEIIGVFPRISRGASYYRWRIH